jgi:PQQ-dependent dehydrogenase (methanol/ethanol family)
MMCRLLPLLTATTLVLAAGAPALQGQAPSPSPSSGPSGAWVDDAALVDAASYTQGWLTHGGNYAEQRYSPLDTICEHNVDDLRLAWTVPTHTRRGLESTPIVVDGIMILTVTWSVVHALDARTGEMLWTWDPEVPRSYARLACCDVVNRGVALYKGKVYVGTLDGRLAALDVRTGALVWEQVTVDQSKPYTITGAPRVVAGKVLIGNGGAEYGVRGYITAYDAETGELAWRTYTVPGDPALGFESEALRKAAETWTGAWWTAGGGGTAWDSLAYDPELDLVYVGTGNGSPWSRYARSPGGGDNLYLSSILALRPATGEQVWHYQTTPGDSWDYTATQHMILADLEIGGRTRKTIMQAPKNGFFYVLDRETGELLSAEPYIPVTWAERVDPTTGRPVERPNADYYDTDAMVVPSALGGHNWQPMSFHPGTGLVYLPAQVKAAAYANNPEYQYNPQSWNTGTRRAGTETNRQVEETETYGFLLAWDPVAQQERWRVQFPIYWNGGVLSTGGNLVFQGNSEGSLVAYRATDGERLWSAFAGTGIVAPPITYSIDGTQYVTVLAGWGGAYGLNRPDPAGAGQDDPGRILTFALGSGSGGGDVVAVDPVQPIRNSEEAASAVARYPEIADPTSTPQRVATGAQVYAGWCASCHGADANGGGVIPDLRRSDAAVFERYPAIVLEGERQQTGMPAFANRVTAEEVEAIRSYIIERRSVMTSTLE